MTQSRATREIEIRHCASLAEYDECIRLAKLVWGGDIVVPSPIFVVAHHTGGQVLGAFDGATLVGFTLALAAMRAGKPYLHSHMTAVLPEFRDSGVGRRLKLFQREDAIKRGIDLIEWTFDPLDLKNAHFNLNILGAVSRRYIPDCYGVTASPLHGGLPTDRLVAEWWLGSERVRLILDSKTLPPTRRAQRIALPESMDAIKASDRAAAARIQRETREQFQQWLAKDYVAASVEARDAEIAYVLEPAASIEGLILPKVAEE
ncbi:MAG TPA: GNAT family N-acetyltransferase [Candidatus Acidoferrales bacterium]|nr:GNAT family N-acetyltransferase [Candidatus Acidoferrales bacterium]